MYICRLLAEAESVSKHFDLKNIIQSNKHIPESSFVDSAPNHNSANQQQAFTDDEQTNKKKAEELVSKIINENGIQFQKEKQNSSSLKDSTQEHGKTSVKFNEDVTTVNITPRNIGRKVEELHHKKRSFHYAADSFVDLIEVKNRVEPVLSTGKAEISQRDNLPQTKSAKPPSGKSNMTTSRTSNKLPPNGLSNKTVSDLGPRQQNVNQNKPPIQNNRPRSASGPLNRAQKPIPTVTVDYGAMEPQEDKSDGNTTKKKKERKDDVLTMMQKLAFEDEIKHLKLEELEKFVEKDNNNDDVEFNQMFSDLICAPTVYKSDPVKNYYEISRHSSASNVKEERPVTPEIHLKEDVKSGENVIIKTTKTIEFDESNPKEVTVKNVIDPLMVPVKEKERTTPDLKPRRPASRPSSAKVW